MKFREALPRDIDELEALFTDAKGFMRKTGNQNQWLNDGPTRASILSDISEGASFVLVDGEEIVASFYFRIGNDSTYEHIYNGKWLSDEPYAVIHRIAVKYHSRGLAALCFSECYRRFSNLKIDTHKDNIPMQKSLLRSGFVYCGNIYLDSGEERLAFQKV